MLLFIVCYFLLIFLEQVIFYACKNTKSILFDKQSGGKNDEKRRKMCKL